MKTRTGILISGRGSNMASLIHGAGQPNYPAEIAIVISNRPDAPGLAIARKHGIRAEVIANAAYGADRGAHEAAIDTALRNADCTIVCLAGYMRLLTPFFIRRWEGSMLNIHPSLLPAFRGLNTHARALAAGVKIHGCTVHLVTEIMDEGPILAQAATPVLPDDTEASLAERVLALEHKIYPTALACHASGRPLPPPNKVRSLINPCIS